MAVRVAPGLMQLKRIFGCWFSTANSLLTASIAILETEYAPQRSRTSRPTPELAKLPKRVQIFAVEAIGPALVQRVLADLLPSRHPTLQLDNGPVRYAHPRYRHYAKFHLDVRTVYPEY